MSAQPSHPGRGAKAILNRTASTPIEVNRYTATDFEYWVDYIWIVHWHTAQPHTQRVIPQPIIHLAAEPGAERAGRIDTAEDDRLLVHGVGDTNFSRTLRGTGHVVGIAFRPAAFHAVLRRPISEITRSVQPLGSLTGIEDRSVARALLKPRATDDEHVVTIREFLNSLALEKDSMIDEMAALVDLAERDATVTRAEQLASHAGVSLRTVQRLFGEYVGIGPKWVIQRFRLLDAAQVANEGGAVDWAATAAELGFSDQAHLTRAFTTLVGTPPASYVRGR